MLPFFVSKIMNSLSVSASEIGHPYVVYEVLFCIPNYTIFLFEIDGGTGKKDCKKLEYKQKSDNDYMIIKNGNKSNFLREIFMFAIKVEGLIFIVDRLCGK